MCIDASDLIELAAGLAGAYLIYQLGLEAYFRQKEFENSRARYLDNGVELVSSHIDYALGVFRHNWTLVLRSLKQYRDIEKHTQFDDFMAQFKELDQAYFQVAPIYKLRALVGSKVFWVAQQHVFAFVGTSNDFFKAEYGPALKAMLARPDAPDKDAFVERAKNKAIELEKKTEPYFSLLGELQTLAELLEKEDFSREGLARFKDRADVKALITRVEQLFPSTKQDDPPSQVRDDNSRSDLGSA